MRRIERLINLIAALLDASRPMTAEEIRDSIAGYDQSNQATFRRAFERNKSALRAMGIPLDVVPVPGQEVDGYTIPKDKYYLPELDLAPDEIAALRLTAAAILGGSGLAESGLMKLSVDAPSMDWSGPRVVWGADVAVEQPLLGTLYGALLERTTVEFGYQSAAGESSTRVIEPYGIVHRAGHWYVVGRDTSRDAVRSFKVSRITDVPRAQGPTYVIPEGFDAAEHLGGEPWEIGDETSEVSLRFDPSVAWWAKQNLSAMKIAETPEGATVTMEVANLDALISWVIGFGERVEIVSPPEARARMLEHLAPFRGQA
jgi:predicted DNA-binding transcriptional regulator YafY